MKTIITILLASLALVGFAQETPKDKSFNLKNTVQLEVGGGGFIYSVNYERILINGIKFNTAIQGGVAFWGQSNSLSTVLRADVTEIIGTRNLKYELGIGITNLNEKSSNDGNSYWNTLIVYRVGVRYQKPDGRFLFRAAFTPIYGASGDTVQFRPWGGLSIGYAF